MKSKFYPFFVLSLLLLFSSCKKWLPENRVVGTWQLVDAEKRRPFSNQSFSTGYENDLQVKIYLADLRNATDIKGDSSLVLKPALNPVKKKLLFNFSTLKMRIDNLEGISFGPRLKNGNRSLLVISDNNFNPLEITQLILLDSGMK